MFIFFEKLMKNDWQTEEYEDIFLYFYFRRRKQRLKNEQREKKKKLGFGIVSHRETIFEFLIHYIRN